MKISTLQLAIMATSMTKKGIDDSEAAFQGLGLVRRGDYTATGTTTSGPLPGQRIVEEEIPRYIWEGMDLDMIRAQREFKKSLMDPASPAFKALQKIDAHHTAIEKEVFDFAKKYAASLYSQGMFSSKTSAKHAMNLALYMLNDIQGTLDEMFEGVISKASASRSQTDDLASFNKLKDAEYEGHGTRKPKPKRVQRQD
jgi:hypothetical protein